MSLSRNVVNQTIAASVNYLNEKSLDSLADDLSKIFSERDMLIDSQKQSYDSALEEVRKLKDILGSPEHILGSSKTKHGEIAEFVEVYIRRASDFVNQRTLSATFDDIPRTGPADYIINGAEVQSKFINGSRSTLNHIIEHMKNYKDFGRDDSFYQIPKDQFKVIESLIKNGRVDNLTLNSQTSLQNKIHEIELIAGKSFTTVVKPSISDYSEVQQGVVFKTVEGHNTNIEQQHNSRIETINESAKEQARQTDIAHQPSWSGAGKAGLVGAGIAGALSLCIGIRKKLKTGKNLNEFTAADWSELGCDTGKAGAKGGITGAALYGLTNFTSMKAPMSAAIISCTFDIAQLYKRYHNNEISISELHENSHIVCLDSAIVALGAGVGSIVIPIPILGTLIGSKAADLAKDHLKNRLSEKEQNEIQRLNKIYQDHIDKLDDRLKIFINTVMEKYSDLNSIMEMAFNYEANMFIRLGASIEFAEQTGVPKEKIIKNSENLNHMFGY